MWKFWSRKNRYPERRIILEPLEERIVLDAAGGCQCLGSPFEDLLKANLSGVVKQCFPPVQSSVLDQVAAGDSAAEHAQSPGDLNVILINDDLDEADFIAEAAEPGSAVVFYDGDSDNLASINMRLTKLVETAGRKISALAVVDHATDAELRVGTDRVTLISLGDYIDGLQLLGTNITDGGQIQFFGCDLAASSQGKDLIDLIGIYTHTNVFASTDTTGGIPHNWTLESSSNAGATLSPLFDVSALKSVQCTLEPVSGADLQLMALVAAQSDMDMLLVGLDLDESGNILLASGESPTFLFLDGDQGRCFVCDASDWYLYDDDLLTGFGTVETLSADSGYLPPSGAATVGSSAWDFIDLSSHISNAVHPDWAEWHALRFGGQPVGTMGMYDFGPPFAPMSPDMYMLPDNPSGFWPIQGPIPVVPFHSVSGGSSGGGWFLSPEQGRFTIRPG